MFEEEIFSYKFFFANNRNDSKVNKILQCKIRSIRVINDKEGF